MSAPQTETGGRVRLSRTESARTVVPTWVVRRLSSRRRIRQFITRLKARRFDDLPKIIGRNDPFENSDSLFRAADYVREATDLPLSVLGGLARVSRPYAARVWRALCIWQEGAEDQAIAALDRMAMDDQYHG